MEETICIHIIEPCSSLFTFSPRSLCADLWTCIYQSTSDSQFARREVAQVGMYQIALTLTEEAPSNLKQEACHNLPLSRLG